MRNLLGEYGPMEPPPPPSPEEQEAERLRWVERMTSAASANAAAAPMRPPPTQELAPPGLLAQMAGEQAAAQAGLARVQGMGQMAAMRGRPPEPTTYLEGERPEEFISRITGLPSTNFVPSEPGGLSPVQEAAARSWQSMQTPMPEPLKMPSLTSVANAPGKSAGQGQYERSEGGVGALARSLGFDEDASRALMAVARTEGGLRGGENTRPGEHDVGIFQLNFMGGQGTNLANEKFGGDTGAAMNWTRANPMEAARWAMEGYLGKTIREGQAKGLSGQDLATYAQRYGQVSIKPETAGANYAKMEQEGWPSSPVQAQAEWDLVAANAPPTAPNVQRTVAPGANPTPNQIDPALSYEEGIAACGPAAFVAFSRVTGRNPTMREAVDLAKQYGWNSAAGMSGPANQTKMLNDQGIPAEFASVNQQRIDSDLAAGKVVSISTPGHYFVLSGKNPDGSYHVGNSGTVYRGGKADMTLAEIQAKGGGLQGAIHMTGEVTPTTGGAPTEEAPAEAGVAISPAPNLAISPALAGFLSSRGLGGIPGLTPRGALPTPAPMTIPEVPRIAPTSYTPGTLPTVAPPKPVNLEDFRFARPGGLAQTMQTRIPGFNAPPTIKPAVGAQEVAEVRGGPDVVTPGAKAPSYEEYEANAAALAASREAEADEAGAAEAEAAAVEARYPTPPPAPPPPTGLAGVVSGIRGALEETGRRIQTQRQPQTPTEARGGADIVAPPPPPPKTALEDLTERFPRTMGVTMPTTPGEAWEQSEAGRTALLGIPGRLVESGGRGAEEAERIMGPLVSNMPTIANVGRGIGVVGGVAGQVGRENRDWYTQYPFLRDIEPVARVWTGKKSIAGMPIPIPDEGIGIGALIEEFTNPLTLMEFGKYGSRAVGGLIGAVSGGAPRGNPQVPMSPEDEAAMTEMAQRLADTGWDPVNIERLTAVGGALSGAFFNAVSPGHAVGETSDYFRALGRKARQISEATRTRVDNGTISPAEAPAATELANAVAEQGAKLEATADALLEQEKALPSTAPATRTRRPRTAAAPDTSATPTGDVIDEIFSPTMAETYRNLRILAAQAPLESDRNQALDLLGNMHAAIKPEDVARLDAAGVGIPPPPPVGPPAPARPRQPRQPRAAAAPTEAATPAAPEAAPAEAPPAAAAAPEAAPTPTVTDTSKDVVAEILGDNALAYRGALGDMKSDNPAIRNSGRMVIEQLEANLSPEDTARLRLHASLANEGDITLPGGPPVVSRAAPEAAPPAAPPPAAPAAPAEDLETMVKRLFSPQVANAYFETRARLGRAQTESMRKIDRERLANIRGRLSHADQLALNEAEQADLQRQLTKPAASAAAAPATPTTAEEMVNTFFSIPDANRYRIAKARAAKATTDAQRAKDEAQIRKLQAKLTPENRAALEAAEAAPPPAAAPEAPTPPARAVEPPPAATRAATEVVEEAAPPAAVVEAATEAAPPARPRQTARAAATDASEAVAPTPEITTIKVLPEDLIDEVFGDQADTYRIFRGSATSDPVPAVRKKAVAELKKMLDALPEADRARVVDQVVESEAPAPRTQAAPEPVAPKAEAPAAPKPRGAPSSAPASEPEAPTPRTPAELQLPAERFVAPPEMVTAAFKRKADATRYTKLQTDLPNVSPAKREAVASEMTSLRAKAGPEDQRRLIGQKELDQPPSTDEYLEAYFPEGKAPTAAPAQPPAAPPRTRTRAAAPAGEAPPPLLQAVPEEEAPTVKRVKGVPVAPLTTIEDVFPDREQGAIYAAAQDLATNPKATAAERADAVEQMEMMRRDLKADDQRRLIGQKPLVAAAPEEPPIRRLDVEEAVPEEAVTAPEKTPVQSVGEDIVAAQQKIGFAPSDEVIAEAFPKKSQATRYRNFRDRMTDESLPFMKREEAYQGMSAMRDKFLADNPEMRDRLQGLGEHTAKQALQQGAVGAAVGGLAGGLLNEDEEETVEGLDTQQRGAAVAAGFALGISKRARHAWPDPPAGLKPNFGKKIEVPPERSLSAITKGFIRGFAADDIDLRIMEESLAKAWKAQHGTEMPVERRAWALNRLAGGADWDSFVRIQTDLAPAIDSLVTFGGQKALDDFKNIAVLRDITAKIDSLYGRSEKEAQRKIAARAKQALKDQANSKAEWKDQDDLLNAQRASGEISQAVFDSNRKKLDAARLAKEQEWADALSEEANKATAAERRKVEIKKWSGGKDEAEIRAELDKRLAALTPEELAAIESTQRAMDLFVNKTRQIMVDAGVLTEELGEQFSRDFPHYIPIDYVDYIKDPANMTSRGKITMDDSGLRSLTLKGTKQLQADPLGAVVRMAFDANRRATRNMTARAVLLAGEMDPNVKKWMRELKAGHGLEENEIAMGAFINGEHKRYAVDQTLRNLIEKTDPVNTQNNPILRFMTGSATLGGRVATERNPLFALAYNPIMDFMTYYLRETSRYGFHRSPEIVGTWVGAAGDAWKGILNGDKVAGDQFQRLLRGGGGQFRTFSGKQVDIEQMVRDLGRSKGFEGTISTVTNGDDLKRLMGDTALLGWVSKASFRIENTPRIAAMMLEEKYGKNALAYFEKAGVKREVPLADKGKIRSLQGQGWTQVAETEAQRKLRDMDVIMAARTVTQDFSQGGHYTKILNQFVPFFNVGSQTIPWLAEMFHENPRGALAMTTGLVIAPVVAAEMYNRSDPERERAYDAIPGYIKDNAVVMLVDSDEGYSIEGYPKYRYIVIPMRQAGPLVPLARHFAERSVRGGEGTSWGDMLRGVAKTSTPLQIDSGGSLLSGFAPGPLGAAVQIMLDRDLWRDRPIKSERANEQAPGITKALAERVSEGTRGLVEPEPSQIEFALRETLGGPAQVGLAGTEIVRKGFGGEQIRAPYEAPGEIPVAGGLIGRFVRHQSGQRSEDLATLREDIRKAQLAEAKKSPNWAKLTEKQRDSIARKQGERATRLVYGTPELPRTTIANLQSTKKFEAMTPDQKATYLGTARKRQEEYAAAAERVRKRNPQLLPERTRPSNTGILPFLQNL